jgi:hypothetical protein
MTARDFVRRLDAEDGHVASGVPAVLAAAGLIALGIGAAGDWGWLALIGGIDGGLAFMVYAVAHHSRVDYPIFARLETLEGTAPAAEEAATITTDA